MRIAKISGVWPQVKLRPIPRMGFLVTRGAPRTATILKDGKVRFFIPGHKTDTPEGAAGEGVAVDAAGNVYGAENTVRGLTKFVKQ